MRLRLGLTIGFGVGYYLGAKAGRSRYEQLHDLLTKARRSDAYETAAGKARDVVDLTVDAAKGFVDEHKPGSSTGASGYDGDLATLTAAGV